MIFTMMGCQKGHMLIDEIIRCCFRAKLEVFFYVDAKCDAHICLSKIMILNIIYLFIFVIFWINLKIHSMAEMENYCDKKLVRYCSEIYLTKQNSLIIISLQNIQNLVIFQIQLSIIFFQLRKLLPQTFNFNRLTFTRIFFILIR